MRETFDALAEELNAAYTHMHLFEALRRSTKVHRQVMAASPLFWSYSTHAHLQAAVSSLCRVFDHHQSGTNFSRLLKHSETLKADAKERQQLERDFDYLDQLKNRDLRTLRIWRNKEIAHKDSNRSKFTANDPLTYDAIKRLIDAGYDILNRYSDRFQNTIYHPHPKAQLNDYRKILVRCESS